MDELDIRQADEEILRLCSVYHSRGPAFGMVSGSGFAAVGDVVRPVWNLLRNGNAGLFHAFRHSLGAELLSGRTELDQSALGYSCHVALSFLTLTVFYAIGPSGPDWHWIMATSSFAAFLCVAAYALGAGAMAGVRLFRHRKKA